MDTVRQRIDTGIALIVCVAGIAWLVAFYVILGKQ